jgi:hypothetical protein
VKGAAVASLQKKMLTDINLKFGTAGIFGSEGCSSELYCCILVGQQQWTAPLHSLKGGIGRKRKVGKSAEKIPGLKYTI